MLKITKKEMIRRMKLAPASRFKAKHFYDNGGGCALGLIFEPFIDAKPTYSWITPDQAKNMQIHNALYGADRSRRLSSGLGYVADAFNAGMEINQEFARGAAITAIEKYLPDVVIIPDLKRPSKARSKRVRSNRTEA